MTAPVQPYLAAEDDPAFSLGGCPPGGPERDYAVMTTWRRVVEKMWVLLCQKPHTALVLAQAFEEMLDRLTP